VLYGANNKAASAIYSNGMTAAWTYDADDSLNELTYSGITGQTWTTTTTSYGPNGNALHQTWSKGDGSVAQTQTWNADGSIHDIRYYGITGQAYTEYEVLYGANNKAASATYSNGMTATWAYNPDDSLKELTYSGITGQKWTTTTTLYGSDGDTLHQSWWKADGSLVQTATWNADGTIHDMHYYGITGQAYSEYEVLYGANGKSASAVYSNGMTATWTYNPDNSLKELAYTGITGQPWTTIETEYGSTGKPLHQVRSKADGTVVQTETWNAAGILTETNYFSSDGSRAVQVKAAGVSVSSSSATDTFTSFGNDDTFVFGAGFGNDVIKNFNAGMQAGHDTIEIDVTLAQTLDDLVLTQVDDDVLVTVSPHDTILVKGVQVTDLQHDFLFV
jgi:hypothetical protein